MSSPRVLINGAGIAGLTLAWWLNRLGFRVEILEARPDLQDQGYMIDFYGSGFDVAEAMGLIPQLQDRHYSIPELEFVGPAGKRRASLSLERFRKLLGYRHFNFLRGDLTGVLYDQVKEMVPIRFGTTVRTISSGFSGVEVELSNGSAGSWDVLIGADGIHSQVRTLLWGAEERFESFLGYTVACGIVPDTSAGLRSFRSRVAPGRQASIYSIRGDRRATFFIYRSRRPWTGRPEERWRELDREFGAMGWVIPEILEAMRHSPHLYFDAVSQVQLDSWYRGRVALVGDACQCLSLLAGQGASMAMAGAYLLAGELDRSPADPAAAFQAYQETLQPEILRRQREARRLAGSFVPRSRFAILLMYLTFKLAFLPGLRTLFLSRIGAKSVVEDRLPVG